MVGIPLRGRYCVVEPAIRLRWPDTLGADKLALRRAIVPALLDLGRGLCAIVSTLPSPDTRVSLVCRDTG